MDKYKNVDTPPTPREIALLRAALDAAERRLGLRGRILKWQPQGAHGRDDALVQLQMGEWMQDFITEVKPALRPQALGLILHQLAPHKDRALLVADYVTPPMAETLKENGIRFIDTAGNAFIKNPPIYVWVKGERPVAPIPAARERGRAFAPSGLRVVLALLCRPASLHAPYRDIAILAGVAHGTVGWVMPELEATGFVGRIVGKRKLINMELLLERWTEAYLRVLRPKLLLGRYRTEAVDWWNAIPLNKYGVTLGGEPAAARLTKHLRPAEITLYVHRAEPRMLIDFKMRKDNHGNIEILRRFWAIDPTAELAPLPVIYADLIGTGDARNIEVAKLVREEFLARSK